MKKLTVIVLLSLMITPCLRAQKKEISQARSYIKSKKNLDKAEQLMYDLLKGDSLNRENPKIYLTLYDAIRAQYEAGNEKLYLQQQYDTTSLFTLTRKMFMVCETFDSLDARPDSRGRVRPEYRRKHARELDAIRLNLYMGGRFFLAKSNYTAAYELFDTYIDCARQPLFDDYHYAERDTLLNEVAYWACYTAYKMPDAALTLRYAEQALQRRSLQEYTLHYMAEAYRWQSDSAHYEATLLRGFHQYPLSAYFFPRLTDYYNAADNYSAALELADEALAVDSLNPLFLFARSTALLNMGRNQESKIVSDRLIALNDSLAEPYFNAGTALLNQALLLEERSDARRQRQRIRSLYTQARPYMERYRQLAPDQTRKWAPALYRIYFNLNLGKQFEEIDKILKKLK